LVPGDGSAVGAAEIVILKRGAVFVKIRLNDMQYLDSDRMRQLDPAAFQQQRPFPWVNVQGLVKDECFRRLCETLPDIESFGRQSGRKRGAGDLYALQYRPGLEVPAPWREFIAELESKEYLDFLRRLFRLPSRQRIELTMHWHYGPQGFSIAPHIDAQRKMGSHIFYLNTEADWDPRWGGQTLVLDDEGRLPTQSRPAFSDLRQVAASEILGNQSFIFQRNDHSWHGVRPVECPAEKLRKVFIVVVNRVNLQVLWRRLRGKDADGYPLR
jgi:2OG-Fe(II) oxygenase superfamily